MQQSVGLTLPTQYLGMLARDGHANPAAFSYATNQLFRGVDLQGKRILEIGSGRGLMALLMGLHGAARSSVSNRSWQEQLPESSRFNARG